MQCTVEYSYADVQIESSTGVLTYRKTKAQICRHEDIEREREL
jgi:hypothetical protein